MSSAAVSEEMFLCSICLEVFSEPVSTPCGHNFCKRCICQTWDSDRPCTCPLCKRSYDTRPELSVNTLLLEMVSQIKLEVGKSELQESKPVVQCDLCSEPKLKALKSCLVCLSSFCETHLQPHLTVSGLKTHQLMEPVENLEPLQCEACDTQTQSQHLVEQRRLKVQEIQHCMELCETEFDSERAAGLQVFTTLMQSVQRRQDRFLEELREKQSRSHKRAQELVQQLEQEICELEKSSTEAERLSCSQDLLHFEPETCEGSAARALAEMDKSLFEEFKELFKQLAPETNKSELRRLQRFAVDITLDPDTAHPFLFLSEDLKQVHDTDVEKKLPNYPVRFHLGPCVLAKQGFSSGRFYFEVQVKGKTKWDIGVVQESIDRKGWVSAAPQNGKWMIGLRNKYEYRAWEGAPVPLSLQRAPQKVGVFVDYGEGLVSFYGADSADLLYSFTGCSFKEKLLPFFSPCLNDGGTNSAPLIISEVQTD